MGLDNKRSPLGLYFNKTVIPVACKMLSNLSKVRSLQIEHQIFIPLKCCLCICYDVMFVMRLERSQFSFSASTKKFIRKPLLQDILLKICPYWGKFRASFSG